PFSSLPLSPPPPPPTSSPYTTLFRSLTFLTPPLVQTTEITGPSAAKLFVSSSTTDADLFLVLRVFSGDLREMVFQGAARGRDPRDRKSTRLNSSHVAISYAVFCLKKK